MASDLRPLSETPARDELAALRRLRDFGTYPRDEAAFLRAALEWASATVPPTLHVDPRIPVLIGLLERAAVQLATDCLYLPEPWRASRRDLAIEIRRECER